MNSKVAASCSLSLSLIFFVSSICFSLLNSFKLLSDQSFQGIQHALSQESREDLEFALGALTNSQRDIVLLFHACIILLACIVVKKENVFMKSIVSYI